MAWRCPIAGAGRKAFPPEHRSSLRRRRALNSRFQMLRSEIELLTQAERNIALDSLTTQNLIPGVFDGATAYVCLPNEIRPQFASAVVDFFKAAFAALSSLGIRDRQYEIVYESIPAHVCAFCGVEPLDAPVAEIPRENLDHYLAFSIYPFAAVNLRNLAPMGQKCNSSYKRAANIIVGGNGARRRCFDPYGNQSATISLLQSRPFEGATKDLFVLPDWHIEFTGLEEETATWDSVFNIRARYKVNVLDSELRSWIDHFAQWWAYDVVQPPADIPSVIVLLRRYIDGVVQEGFSDHTFLKRAAFEMFAYQCGQPNTGERLAEWFISLLSPQTGAVLPGQ